MGTERVNSWAILYYRKANVGWKCINYYIMRHFIQPMYSNIIHEKIVLVLFKDNLVKTKEKNYLKVENLVKNYFQEMLMYKAIYQLYRFTLNLLC